MIFNLNFAIINSKKGGKNDRSNFKEYKKNKETNTN